MKAFPRAIVPLVAGLALVGLPAVVHAQGTEEQQQACTPDAVKLCSDTIPDIGKTTACMKAHFSQLSPRCQHAFNDATGGGSSKSASRPAESRSRTASRRVERPDRGMPDRAMPDRAGRDAAPDREAALPDRPEPRGYGGDDFDATPPTVPGYPPFPSAVAPYVHAPVAGADGARRQIARACRDGLIDSFTCSNTIPLLGGY